MAFKNGNIQTFDYTPAGVSKPKTIMIDHCDGEVWGMDICNLPDGSIRLLTTADDNRVLAYNPSTHTVCCEGKVNEVAKKKKEDKGGYKGGASSMSSQPPKN